jgi:hypothetical protein
MGNNTVTVGLTGADASLAQYERVEGMPWYGECYVVLAEGVSSGTMDSMNLDEVGSMATNDVPAAPEWLVDYFRMIEQWAQAFDRDAVHLTQEEYDAQSEMLRLAELEGL